MKNGSEPISSAAATMRPQSAIGTGFFSTVLMEVATAVSAPASRIAIEGRGSGMLLPGGIANDYFAIKMPGGVAENR